MRLDRKARGWLPAGSNRRFSLTDSTPSPSPLPDLSQGAQRQGLSVQTRESVKRGELPSSGSELPVLEAAGTLHSVAAARNGLPTQGLQDSCARVSANGSEWTCGSEST